ncbi:MAG: DUF433 domain-containing protein [Polyangiaceae bacterium]|nr:DUF433 domain-containing protein [Polyangiaceae bacterium]
MAVALSALEVAALVDLDEGKVRKDVEHGLFEGPRFTIGDLVYFRLVALLGLQVGVDDRKKLHGLVEAAMRRRPTPRTISLGPVTELKVGDVAAEMEAKLERFERWKAKLVEDPKILGGEPVFPKTRTAVRHVGGLLRRGVPAREVREDYPHLGDEDFEFARAYAKAYPKMGRPREAPAR